MQLDLTRYRQPVGHFARTFQPLELGGDLDAYQIAAPVELEFDIHKDKDKFRLVGRVRTELELSCSRCLEPYRFPIDATFDLRYLPLSETAATASGNPINHRFRAATAAKTKPRSNSRLRVVRSASHSRHPIGDSTIQAAIKTPRWFQRS